MLGNQLIDAALYYLVKLINCVFVVIANYVLSKIMVFKKKDLVDYNAEEKSSGEAEKDA